MKLIYKAALASLLTVLAVPAVAAENDCVFNADPTIGQRLTDQFFYEEGLGEAPAPYSSDFQKALTQCIAQYAVPDAKAQAYKMLNLTTTMKLDLAKRLRSLGTDVAKLDRGMIPHIPSASTTYDEMFEKLGPEFDAESARLAKSPKVGPEMGDALLGAYTGAFHAAYVAQLKWDALR